MAEEAKVEVIEEGPIQVEEKQTELPLGDQNVAELARMVGEIQAENKNLKAQLEAMSKQPEVDEEELIRQLDEDRTRQQRQGQKIDIEQLSNAELVGLVMTEVERHFFSPVVHRLELQRVKEELKEVRSKYEDFDKYKAAVHKVATDNPTLSIEDAYLAVKAKAGGFTTQKTEQKVKTLEEVAKDRKVAHGGEKPRGAQATVEKANPSTIEEAVRMAADKIFKE